MKPALQGPPPYPGGVTEVLVDIAECIIQRNLCHPDDSRDRYPLYWAWAVEYEAKFQAEIAAGGSPGENYYGDVEDFAIERALAAGFVDIITGEAPAPAGSIENAPIG